MPAGTPVASLPIGRAGRLAVHPRAATFEGDEMKKARCLLCDTNMEVIEIDRFNKPHGIALMAAGVLFLAAIPAEAILGYALLPFGAVVAFSKKQVWRCPRCSAIADKIAD